MKKETNQYQVVSSDTKLLQKRRKMYQIHEQFQLKKNDFKRQEQGFKADQSQLREKDKQLQLKLTNFCRFLEQSTARRNKVLERFRQEQKALVQREQSLRTLQKEAEQLSMGQQKHLKRAAHLRKYEDYLEKVRSSFNDQYPEMADILTRYHTLKKSNDDRLRERAHFQQAHQTLKKQSLLKQKHLNQSILTINNQIKELARKIEEKGHDHMVMHADVQLSHEENSTKNLNLAKIFIAIDNLNYRCSDNAIKFKYDFDEKCIPDKKQKSRNQNNLQNEEEVSHQQRAKQCATKLKSIISYMRDFKSIIDEYKKVLKHSQKEKYQKY